MGAALLKQNPGWLESLDSEQRQCLEAEVNRRINYDSLTQLPSRTLIRGILDDAVALAQYAETRVGVLVVDLTNFRIINDTLGHDAGDQVLVEAALRLRACVPSGNPIGRVASDEFCIVMSNLSADADLSKVVAAITEALNAPFLVRGREVSTGLNIGAAVYPDDADGPEQALRYANLAMSAARKNDGGAYQRFTVALGAEIERRSRIATLLRGAFVREELHLVYQPLVDSETGAVVAAEALLRWISPELGNVRPDQFIPVAEESGMIIPIGTWALERACSDAAAWCEELGRAVAVAVNVSPRQLLAPQFCDLVADVLDRTGLPAHQLKIEVTEGSLVADVDLCRRVLQELRKLGVVLALDDFGTGYSALSYLQQFEFDILKLDQSFIKKARPGTQAAALTASIISMAACLGMKTVGEGVETEDHVEMLKSNGCNLMQGYLFSLPVERRELLALISDSDAARMSPYVKA